MKINYKIIISDLLIGMYSAGVLYYSKEADYVSSRHCFTILTIATFANFILTEIKNIQEHGKGNS